MADDSATRESSCQHGNAGKGDWMAVQIIDDDPAASDARQVRHECSRLRVGAMMQEKRCVGDVE